MTRMALQARTKHDGPTLRLREAGQPAEAIAEPRALPPLECPHTDENSRSNSDSARVCFESIYRLRTRARDTSNFPRGSEHQRVWQGLSRQPALVATPAFNSPPKEWHLAVPSTALLSHTVSQGRQLYVALSLTWMPFPHFEERKALEFI